MIMNLLTNFASEAVESESKGGFGALGIDAKAFVIQLITWVFVFLVLRKFVFGPIVKILEKRQQTIEKGVELTNEMIAQKEKLDEEVEKALAGARKEAGKIVSKTNEQSAQMLKEAEAATKEKVDRLLKEAKVKIADETARAKRSLEKELVQLVVDATEVVADQKLDAQKDAVLIAKALKESA